MKNDEVKALCLALMSADNEDDVIKLLSDAGLWNNHAAWRFYGDYDNNFNTIGNQQSSPDSAMVEKFVNSVDHRLINECLMKSIDPEGPDAPKSIREAVSLFFEDHPKPGSSSQGRVANWSNEKRTKVARGITLATTGMPPRQGKPCFTISDCGEGQTPNMMPYTLLSLNTGKGNKVRIAFVQGKFNMGSTGVLQFCGRNNLQLILTRRNPALLTKGDDLSDKQWGFTIVRREDPEGGGKSSIFTYLSPLGSEKSPRKGEVLRFSSDTMPIFPEGRDAYGRPAEWGTLIKLYEYAAAGYSNSHILLKDGLLGRLNLLLPDPALPIRLHECRKSFKGHEGSFENNLTGLAVRLEDDRGDNLEEDFPSSCPIAVEGQSMVATIYGFKKGKADTYRKNEGIIFLVNGQTHGYLTKEFFNRKDVGRLNYIADSVLVTVDCTNISPRTREDLFKNSRDRLSKHDIRYAIEEKLEEMLKHHQGLHALKEKRRNEEIQSRLQDEKPLEDILKSLLETSPTLSALFLQGQRATNPFKTLKVRGEEQEFHGQKHPTFFKFKGKEYGVELSRECHINQRCRVTFETDAVNDYFSRNVDPGEFSLFLIASGERVPVADYVGPNLHNGIATLSMRLPFNCEVGDSLSFEAVVTDPTRLDPFVNKLSIEVTGVFEPQPGDGSRRKPPSKEKGDERELPSGISLPNIIPIFEADWPKQTPDFDKYTALRVRISEEPDDPNNPHNGENHDVYDFLINMDNLFVKSELKMAGDEIELIRARWRYALVLVGLALLHDDAKTPKPKVEESENENGKDHDIQTKIEHFTRALAPVILPMIDSLGTFDLDAALATTGSGEAT